MNTSETITYPARLQGMRIAPQATGHGAGPLERLVGGDEPDAGLIPAGSVKASGTSPRVNLEPIDVYARHDRSRPQG
jgi:hypothetical protein